MRVAPLRLAAHHAAREPHGRTPCCPSPLTARQLGGGYCAGDSECLVAPQLPPRPYGFPRARGRGGRPQLEVRWWRGYGRVRCNGSFLVVDVPPQLRSHADLGAAKVDGRQPDCSGRRSCRRRRRRRCRRGFQHQCSGSQRRSFPSVAIRTDAGASGGAGTVQELIAGKVFGSGLFPGAQQLSRCIPAGVRCAGAPFGLGQQLRACTWQPCTYDAPGCWGWRRSRRGHVGGTGHGCSHNCTNQNLPTRCFASGSGDPLYQSNSEWRVAPWNRRHGCHGQRRHQQPCWFLHRHGQSVFLDPGWPVGAFRHGAGPGNWPAHVRTSTEGRTEEQPPGIGRCSANVAAHLVPASSLPAGAGEGFVA